MVGKRLTLFELRVDGDVQVGPSTIPGIGEETTDTDTDEEVLLGGEEHAGSGGRGIAVLVGLAALIAIAVVARKLRNGETDVQLTESDEL